MDFKHYIILVLNVVYYYLVECVSMTGLVCLGQSGATQHCCHLLVKHKIAFLTCVFIHTVLVGHK